MRASFLDSKALFHHSLALTTHNKAIIITQPQGRDQRAPVTQSEASITRSWPMGGQELSVVRTKQFLCKSGNAQNQSEDNRRNACQAEMTWHQHAKHVFFSLYLVFFCAKLITLYIFRSSKVGREATPWGQKYGSGKMQYSVIQRWSGGRDLDLIEK